MTNIKQSKFEKATKVFNSVFSKYDIMNDLMSLGIHRIWKKKLISWMNPNQEDHLVDIASGTGDVAKSFLIQTNLKGKVSCVEPNKLMLEEGKKKLSGFKNIDWYLSSAEKLPFKNETFDIYSVSFGVRNFSNINQSMKEAHRVLKIGGRFICLDISKVDNEILRKFYKLYSKSVKKIPKGFK